MAASMRISDPRPCDRRAGGAATRGCVGWGRARRLRTDVVRPRARRAVGDLGRLLPPAVHPARARARRLVPGAGRRRAACRSSPTTPATSSPGGAAGSGPGVLTGSHLDSVLDGGAYDGPLGVVSALAAIDELRSRGVVPARPIGVSVFVEEEGSRFGLACLGSRLAAGAITWEKARVLRDRDGVAFEEVVEGGGPGLLEGVGVFVELHVEQGRDLVDRGAAIGVASEIWPHGRYRFDFAGEANHAGSTRMEDRADPMLTYAMTALAANKQARLAGERATFGRVEVTPNGTNAVPSQVLAWLDARCSSEPALAELVETVTRQATERAERDGTAVDVTAESVSGAVAFDPDLARRIAAGPRGRRLADHPDRGRPRRRNPFCARDSDRDALRPQPHRRLPLAGRDGVDPGLPGRRARARRDARAAGHVTSYLLERAWVDGAVHDDVLVEIDDGRFTKVELVERVADLSGIAMPDHPGNPRSTGDPTRLAGLTIPGLANCHSHAFHRALRGRTQRERGTFWTWRDPDVRRRRAAGAGVLLRPGAGDVPRDARRRHHVGGGVPLPAPPARRDGVRRAERDAARARVRSRRGRAAALPARHGLLLQRLRRAVEGAQRRFSDGDAEALGGARRRRAGGDPLRPRGAARAAAGLPGPRAAARPPVRAGRRERRLPRGVRRHPHPAAARGRPARPGHHGGARDAPDRRRHRAARHHRHQRLHHADHRA